MVSLQMGSKRAPETGRHHQQRVDLAFGQAGELLLGGEVDYFELEVGVFGCEGTDNGREQNVLANRAAGDTQAQAGVESADALAGCIDRVEDALGVLAEGVACVGEPDVLAGALKELRAKDLFKRLDLER